MKRNNFNTLISEEMKNRFEGAIKEEINIYRKEKEQIFKNFELLNHNLNVTRTEIESLKNDNIKWCENISKSFLNEKNNLESSFDEQRRTIRNISKEIKEIVDDFNKTRCEYSTNEVIENHINALVGLISCMKVDIHSEIEKTKNLIDQKVKELASKCNHEINLYQDEIKKMAKTLEESNHLIEDFKIIVEGFSREITVMKKTNFVTEKMIEDLYTQLERVRG